MVELVTMDHDEGAQMAIRLVRVDDHTMVRLLNLAAASRAKVVRVHIVAGGRSLIHDSHLSSSNRAGTGVSRRRSLSLLAQALSTPANQEFNVILRSSLPDERLGKRIPRELPMRTTQVFMLRSFMCVRTNAATADHP
jgi:hypothetical protein